MKIGPWNLNLGTSKKADKLGRSWLTFSVVTDKLRLILFTFIAVMIVSTNLAQAHIEPKVCGEAMVEAGDDIYQIKEGPFFSQENTFKFPTPSTEKLKDQPALVQSGDLIGKHAVMTIYDQTISKNLFVVVDHQTGEVRFKKEITNRDHPPHFFVSNDFAAFQTVSHYSIYEHQEYKSRSKIYFAKIDDYTGETKLRFLDIRNPSKILKIEGSRLYIGEKTGDAQLQIITYNLNNLKFLGSPSIENTLDFTGDGEPINIATDEGKVLVLNSHKKGSTQIEVSSGEKKYAEVYHSTFTVVDFKNDNPAETILFPDGSQPKSAGIKGDFILVYSRLFSPDVTKNVGNAIFLINQKTKILVQKFELPPNVEKVEFEKGGIKVFLWNRVETPESSTRFTFNLNESFLDYSHFIK